MKNTGIQWADDTVNPTSGCDGCELWIPGRGGPCYAGNFHQERLSKSLPQLYDPEFTKVREIPGRMTKAARCMDLTGHDRDDKPWLNGQRRKIFVGDLGDIFSASVTNQFIKDEIVSIATSPNGARHDFQLLTKQPGRMAKFAHWLDEPWPDNIWVGTSITSVKTHKRIADLRQVPAKVRFLSLEPLIGDHQLTPELLEGIHWIIIGGESNQGVYVARDFHIEWVRSLIPICRQLKISLFVKQMGSNAFESGERMRLVDHHGGDWSEWPEDVRIRQVPSS